MVNKLFKNKILTAVILILIFLGGYFGYKNFFEKENNTRYILKEVQKGTITISVSGSGQILSSDQTDIRPKVSGEVEEIFVEKDQSVKEGELLLKLRTKDYERAIDEARIALDNDKITLENLKKSKENSQKDLNDSYQDAFKEISSTFKELPQIIVKLEPIFTKSSYQSDQGDIDYYQNVVFFYSHQPFIKNEKERSFLSLKEKYQVLRNDYLTSFIEGSSEVLEDWLKRATDLVKEISDLSRKGREIISFYKEKISEESLTPPIPISITENQLTLLDNITTNLDQKSSILSSLSKIIQQLKDKISDLEDQIEIQEKKITQRENALEKAKENYENCFVRAPFEGKISRVNSKKGDLVSNATTLFTMISNQKIAEISLNEVDMAKVTLGQKATLTFDALPELTLTGKISEIDSVGTISQGVVSYAIKIVLDGDDERIKPGMSVTADIIVDIKSDVLVLPNSALKSQGKRYYVEIVEMPREKRKEYLDNRGGVILPTPPKQQEVETGISNDRLTEVLSGLKEGDIVVLSTITPSKNNQNIQRFQIPGMGGQMRFR